MGRLISLNAAFQDKYLLIGAKVRENTKNMTAVMVSTTDLVPLKAPPAHKLMMGPVQYLFMLGHPLMSTLAH